MPLSSKAATWGASSQLCATYGMQLASFSSAAELRYVFDNFYNPSYYPQIWLGVVKVPSVGLRFSDGNDAGTLLQGNSSASDAASYPYAITYDGQYCGNATAACCGVLTSVNGTAPTLVPLINVTTCSSINLPGVCLQPASPPPPSPIVAPKPAAARVNMQLSMDFYQLVTSPVALADFKSTLQANIARALSIGVSRVSITSVVPGSVTVIAEVVIPDNVPQGQGAVYVSPVVNRPDLVIDADFRSEFGVTSQVFSYMGTVELAPPPPMAPPSPPKVISPSGEVTTSQSTKVVIAGVVSAVGCTLVIGALCGFSIWKRHKRMVERQKLKLMTGQ